MRKARDAGAIERLLHGADVLGAKFDPRSAKSMLVIYGLRLERRAFRELDTERAAVGKRHEQYRILHAEVQLAYVTAQYVAK